MTTAGSKSTRSSAPTMKALAIVTLFRAEPEKQRVAVMFLGRAAFYYAPAANRSMIDALHESYTSRGEIQVEWDPISMQILRVARVP